ncbi:hypothetical protein Lepto7375DRAFT_6543 [Leptolyngbya sp. PCC 7375]|nr:hypothetical protein Lepto7375DRAFT_6543 [Leptolyngbya sp. PCC 7375]
MATQAGIGVLIGLGIGSGVTAFLMQRIIRRQDNALQQSINRLNRIQEDHAQDLNAALEKMAADYEQQLAAKIERYQDTHEEQLTELDAEYEARIAALTSIGFQEETNAVPETMADAVNEVSAPPIEATQPIPEQTFTPIPDPWAESNNPPGTISEPVAPPETVATTPVETTTARGQPNASHDPQLTQTVAELGKTAALNRKEAIRAVPQLGKLTKDADADVRLAAITALQQSGSIKAIPFLRQALRDTDSRVVAAASAALNRFKGSKKPAPKAKKTNKTKRRR